MRYRETEERTAYSLKYYFNTIEAMTLRDGDDVDILVLLEGT